MEANHKTKSKTKKKRRPEADLEQVMENPGDNLKFQNLDLNKSSSDYLTESEDDEFYEEVSSDSKEERMEQESDDKSAKNKVTIWDETNNKLNEGEILDYDNSAYEMLHRCQIEWPCMSIDFIQPENFYPPVQNFFKTHNIKDVYPYTTYMVAGGSTTTQNGIVYSMKWSNMHKTKYDDDPDNAPESDEEEGQEPVMTFEKAPIKGNINRLKTLKNSYLCAMWTDAPSVAIVDLRDLINNLEYEEDKSKNKTKKKKYDSKQITLNTFQKKLEGFALNWSEITPSLAIGGYEKKIEIIVPKDENCSSWTCKPDIFKGHTDSIEDIVWSPTETDILGSCSVDRSIKFWDLRENSKQATSSLEKAHESDINVMDWNKYCKFMVATGSDDCSFKVWDIRYLKHGPISNILWHKGPITAMAWDPFEDSQIAICSEDNRLSVWDFAVEPDDKQMFDNYNKEIPQQLVFLHQGQTNLKDVKFHPYYKNTIVSTAENGINIFKPGFDGNESIYSDE